MNHSFQHFILCAALLLAFLLDPSARCKAQNAPAPAPVVKPRVEPRAVETDSSIIKPREAIGLILPKTPNQRPAPAYISAPVEKFFNTIQKGDVDTAFKDFLANSDHIHNRYDVDDFVAKTKYALSVYGAMQGFELYDNRAVGARLMYLTYFMHLKAIPLRWRFVFYAPDGQNWKLINLSVDDLLDQSILSAE